MRRTRSAVHAAQGAWQARRKGRAARRSWTCVRSWPALRAFLAPAGTICARGGATPIPWCGFRAQNGRDGSHIGKGLDLVLHDRLVGEIDQRLGFAQGERPQPGAEAADKNQGLHGAKISGRVVGGGALKKWWGARAAGALSTLFAGVDSNAALELCWPGRTRRAAAFATDLHRNSALWQQQQETSRGLRSTARRAWRVAGCRVRFSRFQALKQPERPCPRCNLELQTWHLLPRSHETDSVGTF